MGQARNPPTHWTTLRENPVLSCPPWPCDRCMCVIAKGAVSIGSHMQQDMGFSKARPQLGAPIRLFEYRSLQKTTIQKMAIIPPETQLSSVSVPTRVCRPAGRHMYRIIAVYVAAICSELLSNKNCLLPAAYFLFPCCWLLLVVACCRLRCCLLLLAVAISCLLVAF